MTYYIIKSGSIQDINSARKFFNNLPSGLDFYLLECDGNGNVIREV